MTMREVGRRAKRPVARSGSITPAGKAVYQALARRALAGERFAFPADLTAPALIHRSQPLTEEGRAEAQRWALELSRMDDPDARQATLATAPALLNRPFGLIWRGSWA